jgi:hypothetical protein
MFLAISTLLLAVAFGGDEGVPAEVHRMAVVRLKKTMPPSEFSKWLPHGYSVLFFKNKTVVVSAQFPVHSKEESHIELMRIPAISSIAWEREIEFQKFASPAETAPTSLESDSRVSSQVRWVLLGSDLEPRSSRSSQKVRNTLQIKPAPSWVMALGYAPEQDPWVQSFSSIRAALIVYPSTSSMSHVWSNLERGCEENPSIMGVTVITSGWRLQQFEIVPGFTEFVSELASRGCLVVDSSSGMDLWRATHLTLEYTRLVQSRRFGELSLLSRVEQVREILSAAGRDPHFGSDQVSAMARSWMAPERKPAQK